jgi:V/A-type H+-transporting ATPase subunit I
MTLRPQAARWFELLVPREALSAALTALSRTGAVQLEARSGAAGNRGAAPPAPAIAQGLARLQDLRRRFGAYWPAPRLDAGSEGIDPAQRLARAVARVEDWVARAEPRVATVEGIESERDRLALLRRFLQRAGGASPRPDRLAQAGPLLAARLFRVGRQAAPLVVPEGVLVQRVADGEGAEFVLAVGEGAAVAELERGLPPGRTESVPLPRWLPAEARAVIPAVDARIETLGRQLVPLRDELLALAGSTALEAALGDAAFVEWFVTQVPDLETTARFAWVTGWMRDARDESVRNALAGARVPYLVRHPPPPEGLDPPVTLRNPRWAAPFEFFVGLLGTPGREEADPSLVLSVVAPLLFGFMFGDVGQGAVLVALGIALRRRLPALSLLVPGGLASMAFGLLFGSVFGREDVLPALWLHPLESPLTLLGASLALGVAIIATGLAIEALAHVAAGHATTWLAHRAGLALAYAGGVLAPFRPAAGGALALGGVAALLAGAAAKAAAGRRLPAAGAALAEFIETALQMAVNTVSFLRVGAFALAHAGLSVAIVGLSQAAGSRAAQLLVLVLGNVFVIALEAMVVGIQTTRLVLFEFFIRFLRGTGRAFRPLPGAPLSSAHGPGGNA